MREVCIDMDPFYLGVAEECFPEARVVIDHFHVIQWGLKLTEDLRRNLQTVHRKKFKVADIIRKPVHKLKPHEIRKLN